MIDLLQKSIAKYRAVLDHAESLEGVLIKDDPKLLIAYTLRLDALQQEAGLGDHELLVEFARDSAGLKAHPLFQQRMQLLERIVEMNQLLLPRARGMMAVTAAELAQLKGGRVAVSGYIQGETRNKKSVRGIG
jgi:hypothetical protein